MNNTRLWQFNVACSLILLMCAMGIFWSWRETLGIGYVHPTVSHIPLSARQDIDKKETITPVFISSSTPAATLPTTTVAASTTASPPIAKKELPKEMNLNVPFTSQAPEKRWDQPWQDACEEAAVLMLAAYYNNYGLSPLFSKDELLKMVAWEQARQWENSIDIEKIKLLVDEFVLNTSKTGRLTPKIIAYPTVEQIKQHIANGTPVLVVADGKTLPNPHFNNGGPVYHALIIRGYTEDSFITNDPGTQFGKNFSYTYDELMSSIHDWNNGEVYKGKPAVLVIE